MRQTLDHTPGTHIYAPGVFPAAAFSKSGHCALPESLGAARQPVEVGSREGANFLQGYTSLETSAPSMPAMTGQGVMVLN